MKLIQIKNYLLFIDEVNGFKRGDWNYEIDNTMPIYQFDYDIKQYPGNKIIGYYPLTKEAKELDLPLLPPFEEEVNLPEDWLDYWQYKKGLKELVNDANKDFEKRNKSTDKTSHRFGYVYGVKHTENRLIPIIQELKAAQSKRFSLEDIQKAISFGRGLEIVSLKESTKEVETTKFIQSLSTSQQLPKEFIPETYCNYGDDCPSKGAYDKQHLCDIRIKTRTNSEGKQELVGTWKFAE